MKPTLWQRYCKPTTTVAPKRTRRIYENADSLADEQKFADCFAEAHQHLSLRKLPMSYTADFAVVSLGEVCGFVEFRRRFYSMDELFSMGGYQMSVQKVMNLQRLHEQTGRPVHFYLQTLDCAKKQFWKLDLAEVNLRNLRLMWWVNEQRGDWQDTEPAALIPTRFFVPTPWK